MKALIIVGVEKYKHEWPDLPFVRTSIDTIREIFESQGYSLELAHLCDDPSSPDILRSLRDFLVEPGRFTEVVIYWAGHGHTDLGCYLVARNTPRHNLMGDNAVSATALAELFVRSAIGQITLILDTCYSGLAADKLAMEWGLALRGEISDPNEARYLEIVTSTQSAKVPDAAFTDALQHVLAHGPLAATDNRFGWSDADAWLRLDTVAQAIDNTYRQHSGSPANRTGYFATGKVAMRLKNPRFGGAYPTAAHVTDNDLDHARRRRRFRLLAAVAAAAFAIGAVFVAIDQRNDSDSSSRSTPEPQLAPSDSTHESTPSTFEIVSTAERSPVSTTTEPLATTAATSAETVAPTSTVPGPEPTVPLTQAPSSAVQNPAVPPPPPLTTTTTSTTPAGPAPTSTTTTTTTTTTTIATTTTLPLPPTHLLSVYRCMKDGWDCIVGDLYNATAAEISRAPEGTVEIVGEVGYVQRIINGIAVEGTQILRICYSSARPTQWLSLSVTCKGKPNGNALGLVYLEPPTEFTTVRLYQCSAPGTGFLVTTDLDACNPAENPEALGWIFPLQSS